MHAKSGLKRQTEPDTSTLITEEQLLFSSAAAFPAHDVAAAVRAMFARPEKPRARRQDYAERFGYLENSLVAREMSRGM